ncbi:MAG: DUF2306 domain-containing protein [Granulosicoccaceae bacterium]
MSYTELAYAHLATLVPAFIIGTTLLMLRKGSAFHRQYGRYYMMLMLVTSLISLFMPARIGPHYVLHFGWIHLFSLAVLVSIPMSYFSIKRKMVKLHIASMVGVYGGALWIAGAFAFSSDRMLYAWFFGPEGFFSAL